MANPRPAWFLNFPIVDPKTGTPTADFTRWLNQVMSQIANLTLDGNLNAGMGQQVNPAMLAKQIANLDSNGIVLPNGIDLSRSYINKYLDYINDGTQYVRLASSHARGNVAYNYKGVWSSTTSYVVGDEVVYGPSYWIAIAANSNSAPATGNSNWQVVGSYSAFRGAWSSTVSYVPGDEVTYSGNYWVCVTANTNSAPSMSNSNWQVAGPASLDSVSDGTTYQRMPAANMDTNRRALIDFSQSGHVNKVLDNIGDGTTYLRMPGSNMDANRRALIDFSQSGHVNKVLDNIGDGTTYLRMPGSNMDANRRGLIDFTQAGHIGKVLGNIADDPNGGRFANRWFYLAAGANPQWFKLGTWVAGNYGDVLRLDYAGGAGFNTNGAQQAYAEIVARSGNNTAAPNLAGISWYQSGGTQPIIAIKAAATGGSTSPTNQSWDIYVELTSYAHGQFEAILTPGSTFTFSGASASDPGAASSTVVVGTGGAVLGVGGTGLDAVLDGGTYLRMPGSNMDANRRALIDFTQAGHVGKVLDNIGDGTTYLRMPGSNMDANRRALIDFTQSGHIGKNLANVADDVSAGRAAYPIGYGRLQHDLPYNGDWGLWVPNPSGTVPFSLGSNPIPDGWTPNFEGSGSEAHWVNSTSDGRSGFTIGIANGDYATCGAIASRPFSVRPGAKYLLTCMAWSTVANPGTMYLRMCWYGNTNNFARSNVISFSDAVASGGPSTAQTWTQMSGQVTAPAGAVFGRVALYNWNGTSCTIYWDYVRVQENAFTSSAVVNPQASVPPTPASVTGSFSATTTPSVQVTINAGTVYYPDGTTDSVPAFSNTYTTWAGQTVAYPPTPAVGTKYNYYIGNVVWNRAASQVQVQQTSAVMNTALAPPPTPAASEIAQAYADGLVKLLAGAYAAFSTSSSGGTSGGSGGGGGSCPLVGTEIVPLGSPAHSIEFDNKEWIEIETDGGKRLCATPSHRIYTSGGLRPLRDVKGGDIVVTKDGEQKLTRVETRHFPGRALKVEMETGHLYWAGGILSHNMKV